MVPNMTIAADRQVGGREFRIEDMSTGAFASGFGQLGDGRSFSFYVEHAALSVEVYRPRLSGPVPQAEDVVATARRAVADIDIADARSLGAAVQDTVELAEPIGRDSQPR